jgi:hypothetical protein
MSDIWAGKTDQPSSSRVEPEDELWTGREPTRNGDGLRPDRPTQLTARVLLVAILIGGPLLLGWVGSDLLSVRGSLQEAVGALRELRSSLGEVDLARSEAALAVAEREIGDASRRASRFTWSVATVVPVIGPSVETTRDVVEVVAATVEIAAIAVADGRELVGEGVVVTVDDGQVDLAPLVRAQAVLASLPLDRLVATRDALGQPHTAWLPDVIRSGRADVLELADDTIGTLERAGDLTSVLPAFLGAEGPRAYFVGLQTSAELRGTGGMIGFWGVLSVDDGRVSFGESEEYDPFDDAGAPSGETRTSRIATIGLSPTNPPDVDPAYYARYGFASGARSFPNINLDPDLPTTAKAALDLFEHQTGRRLDGVVLLDPVGLQGLLEATGEYLPLPDDLNAEFGFNDGIPVQGFARFVTADIYETHGFDRSDVRNRALREIGDAAFLRIFDGSWESRAMARAVVVAAAERQLQVFSSDPDTQASLQGVGITGDLEIPTTTDRFAVTANNVVGGKQDVWLGHEVSFAIALDEVRRTEDGELVAARELSITATVDNPLPDAGMDAYIIGNCYVPGRVNRCFEGEPGNNRTWFSVWASPLLLVEGFESDDGTQPNTLNASFRGLRVVDHLHSTPSSGRSSFRLDGGGPVPLRRGTETVIYEFEWWRQSKAIPDLLDVRVQPPAGWAVGDVEVVGGGSGVGMGVHGDGEALTVEVQEGAVHLRGTVSADTRLQVHLVAPHAFAD